MDLREASRESGREPLAHRGGDQASVRASKREISVQSARQDQGGRELNGVGTCERVEPENAPSHQDDDWYYDRARWREMTDHAPQPGELVGYMVAAGDTRGFGNVAVQERSAIVLVEFPTDAGREYMFGYVSGELGAISHNKPT